MGIYMGAFVEVDSGKLQITSAWSKLRIFCAGVWHNIVLALAAYTFLANLPCKREGTRVLSYSHCSDILSPAYTSGRGVVVANVAEWSVLRSSINISDVIMAIGKMIYTGKE